MYWGRFLTTQWTGNRRKWELEKDGVRKNMPEVTYYLWLGPTSERFHNLTKGCHTVILFGDPSIHKTSEENFLYLICNNRLIPFLTVTNVSVKHMHTHSEPQWHSFVCPQENMVLLRLKTLASLQPPHMCFNSPSWMSGPSQPHTRTRPFSNIHLCLLGLPNWAPSLLILQA